MATYALTEKAVVLRSEDDVAVAKARNVNYYADPAKLQSGDRIAGVPVGTAFTNRTFRFLALPRFPSSVDGTPPAPFSILNDGGANPFTGRQVGCTRNTSCSRTFSRMRTKMFSFANWKTSASPIRVWR